MEVHAIKTRLVKPGDQLKTVISESILGLEEKSVLVIASKVFSFCENRLIQKTTESKDEKWQLARQEADWWLPPNESQYQCMLTIKGNWMFANAGIDESNSGGNYYSLWPKDPQQSVNDIWQFLRQHYQVKDVGVIMSDSRSMPLNWGVVGHAVAYCGFENLKSYIGKPDLHGRLMQMEQVSMSQSLAVAGTLEMGEGNEQTPIAVVTQIPNIVFQDHTPTKADINPIEMKDDIYAPLLMRVPWQRGEGGIK